MTLNIALNIAVIVFMACGIFYAWRLQGAFKRLADNRAAMEKFVADFSGTIARAEKAIRDLNETARSSGESIDDQLRRAHGLRDELTFLVEAADKIATRLSDNTSLAQSGAKAQRAQSQIVEKLPVERKDEPKHEAVQPEKRPDNSSVPQWVKRVAVDTTVINAPVEKAAPVSGLSFGRQPVVEKTPAKEQPKSQAERDLLQALEKMR